MGGKCMNTAKKIHNVTQYYSPLRQGTGPENTQGQISTERMSERSLESICRHAATSEH